jgi:Arc/MetJ-type ribon-helix-helix transcriptional regulator
MSDRDTVSKFSVSIPAELAAFIEHYRREHRLGSRSEVIKISLTKLREADLAEAYREHAEDWRDDPDREFWDRAGVDDGLNTDESRW